MTLEWNPFIEDLAQLVDLFIYFVATSYKTLISKSQPNI